VGDSSEEGRIGRAREEAMADIAELADSWTVERTLSPRQASVVQDWFQFPTAVQTLAALALMVFYDFGWWQATLLAWCASTPAAMLIRAAPSKPLLAIARVLRSTEALAAIAAGAYFVFTRQWWDLVPAVAALFGLLGMACPGYAIMCRGKGGVAPKAVFARAWFGDRSPAPDA
jgi:hypothetical protein